MDQGGRMECSMRKKLDKARNRKQARRKQNFYFALVCVIGILLVLGILSYRSRMSQRMSTGKIVIDPKEVDHGIPLFLQADRRWGERSYGSGPMKETGCGPTCLSMVRCGLGHDGKWDPFRVATLAERKGFYVYGSGSSWDLMTEGARMLGMDSRELSCDASQIIQSLREGKPVICAVGPGDFTTQGHFIVLAGIGDSGKIIVHDPNSQKNSEKAWEIERILKQIKNLWAFTLH